jgi:polysaccharide export outer membrane protein
MRSPFGSICFLVVLGTLAVRPPASCAFQFQDVTVAGTTKVSEHHGEVLLANSGTNAEPVDARPAPADYVIGPSDVLAVNIWREPEISRTVPVRPDGKISLPLVGDLHASGATAEQLQNLIKRQLQAYIAHPEVTVIVQEVKSQQVNIFGEVAKPGSYVLARNMTVLDALAVAGGLKDFAKATKIYVLRVGKDGGRSRIPFNYKQAIKGRNPAQDIELHPRDTVVVP